MNLVNVPQQAVLDLVSDAYFVKSADGKYLSINAAGASMVGSTPDEIIGIDDFQIFEKNSALETIEWDQKVIVAHSAISYHTVSTAKKITRIYQSTKTPLQDSSGKVLAIVGVSRCITPEALAKLSHATQELGKDFDLSHELRTPLTVLTNVIDIESKDLKSGIVRPSEFRSKLLDNARSANRRLQLLIQALKL